MLWPRWCAQRTEAGGRPCRTTNHRPVRGVSEFGSAMSDPLSTLCRPLGSLLRRYHLSSRPRVALLLVRVYPDLGCIVRARHLFSGPFTVYSRIATRAPSDQVPSSTILLSLASSTVCLCFPHLVSLPSHAPCACLVTSYLIIYSYDESTIKTTVICQD